jgi:beta-glucosidase
MRGDFLWGVATSAFQLEGSPYADWAGWDAILKERPDITNHYAMFREDLSLLKELGVNSYRFSVEWSRIQPEEGRCDTAVIEHYREIIGILKGYSIEPMVTLHHFTHPLWFIRKYPWHEDASVEKFLAFAEKMIAALKGVEYWITFNEPYVLILGGYLEGCMPPGIKDPELALRALRNILYCHAKVYDMIHDAVPDAKVSIAHNMAALAPWHKWNPLDRGLSRLAKYFYNHSVIDAFLTGRLRIKFPFRRQIILELPVKDKLDFFGVNYYTRIHIRFNPFRKMLIELRHHDIDGFGLSDLGWEIHPRGLEKVLRYASRLNVPLIITENGIATRNPQKKIAFMRKHVDAVERSVGNGVDVKGYFYWSLIDNYEWLEGLDARFGLYRVDFKTMRRKPTSAAAYYSYLIQSRSSLHDGG